MKLRERDYIILVLCLGVMLAAAAYSWFRAHVSRLDMSVALRLPADVDPEQRTTPLSEADDPAPDMSAYQGMPAEYRQLIADYMHQILAGLESTPLMRDRYYHKDRSSQTAGRRFPDDVNPVFDRPVRVPVILLPRAGTIEKWIETNPAIAAGWRTMDDAIDDPLNAYGRTVIFEPGARSEEPTVLPAAPLGYWIPSWDLYSPGLISINVSFTCPLGKAVTMALHENSDGALCDGLSELHLGEDGGAVLNAEILTVPVFPKNGRLFWVSRTTESENERFLAYALIDGNGGFRVPNYKVFFKTREGLLSPYIRPLTCDLHQPRVRQHDLLLMPVPIGRAPFESIETRDFDTHEVWCLDGWFQEQSIACWTIRETKESRPLRESFVLQPASESSELPLFVVSVFPETEPRQLIEELSVVYGTSPQKVLESPETMRKLNQLYDRIQAFQFSD